MKGRGPPSKLSSQSFRLDVSHAAVGSNVVLQDHVASHGTSASTVTTLTDFSTRLSVVKTGTAPSDIDDEVQVPFSDIDAVSSRIAFEDDSEFFRDSIEQQLLLPHLRGRILPPKSVGQPARSQALIFNALVRSGNVVEARIAIRSLREELSARQQLRMQAYIVVPDVFVEDVIEIVPSQTLLQVSSNTVLKIGLNIHKVFVKQTLIAVLAAIPWISLSSVWIAANFSSAATDASLKHISQGTLALYSIYFAVFVIHLSSGLLKCLMLSFECWMFCLWIGISIAVQLTFWGDDLRVSLSATYALLHVCSLLTDASPALSRSSKGVLQLLAVLLNCVIFGVWSARNSTVGNRSTTINITAFKLDVSLMIVGQCAVLSLALYHSRLAIRYLMMHYDLAVIDFPVRSVEYLHNVEDAGTNSGRLMDAPPRFVLVHAQGSLPWNAGTSAEERDRIVGSLDAAVKKVGDLLNVSIIDSDLYEENRRTFQPSMLLMLFSPAPLLKLDFVIRIMRSSSWPSLVAVCGCLSIVVFELIIPHSSDMIWLQVLLRCFWIVLCSAHLFCGVSTAMIAQAIRTLDFWFFVCAFFARNSSSIYVYTSTAPPVVTAVHMILLTLVSLAIALLDCITLPCFSSLLKGGLGAAAALYEIYDGVYKFPSRVKDNPSLYAVTVDVGFTTADCASISETAGLVLFLYFLKIFVRSVLMRSTKVFIQFPAVEEHKAT